MKRLPTSNCCKMRHTQADETSQNTLSEKCILLHHEDAFDQFCPKDTLPLRPISFSDGQIICEPFGPVNWISSISAYPLEFGLVFTKTLPILAGASRSGAEVWHSIKDAGSQYFPGFQGSAFKLTSLSSLFPGLGLRDCHGDSCV